MEEEDSGSLGASTTPQTYKQNGNFHPFFSKEVLRPDRISVDPVREDSGRTFPVSLPGTHSVYIG